MSFNTEHFILRCLLQENKELLRGFRSNVLWKAALWAWPWSPASEQLMTHRKASQDQSCCCSPTGGMGKSLRPSSERLDTCSWPSLPDVCNSTLMLLVSGSASMYRDQMLAEGAFYFCSYEEVSKHCYVGYFGDASYSKVTRALITNQTLTHAPVMTINPSGHQTGLGRNHSFGLSQMLQI